MITVEDWYNHFEDQGYPVEVLDQALENATNHQDTIDYYYKGIEGFPENCGSPDYYIVLLAHMFVTEVMDNLKGKLMVS